MTISQLYVFAGPNGAGKSMLSATLLAEGTPIFDGDKEFAKLKQQFDATDSGTLYDAVNGHIFEDWKNAQLNQKHDCAFEINFRSAEVMDTVKQFKLAGYQTNLVWFGLPDLAGSVARVELRVQSGGHPVSLPNIEANYSEGIKNLERYYKDFDQVGCYQNFATLDKKFELRQFINFKNGTIVSQADGLPKWLSFFERSVQRKKHRGRRI